MHAVLAGCIVTLGAHALPGADLSVDQQLIVACYRLDVNEAVACLRRQADVNARFGDGARDIGAFRNRWTGGFPIAVGSWTPLLALAASPNLPEPPADKEEIWRDPRMSAELRRRIPREQVDQRRADARTILLLLLSHRCKIDDADGHGATAVYLAADKGKAEIVRLLLKFGANPNTRTGVYIDGPGDTTPLHVATPSREAMQLLLDHGADASAKDSEGKTAADWLERHSGRDFDLVNTPNGWRLRSRDADKDWPHGE